MSTDFNIKPVGAPVAAPIVQHVSEAAQHAVATELPASQSVAAVDASARASTDSAAVRVSISSASVSNQVVIDRDARAVVYQVIDTRTSQVVKQFPEEAVLRRRAYFHALDLTKDAPAAPSRHRPQGLGRATTADVSSRRRCVGLVEIGLAARRIGDDVLDLRFPEGGSA